MIRSVNELDDWDRGEIRRTMWSDPTEPVPTVGTLVAPEDEECLWEVIDLGRAWRDGHRVVKRYLYLVRTELTAGELEQAELDRNRRRIATAAAELFDEAVAMYGAVREDFPKSGRVDGVVMNYEIPGGPRGAVLRMNDGRLVAVEFKNED